MEKMKLGDFEFPHNPESILLQEGEQLAVHFLPGVGEQVQWMGHKARKITCKGRMCGTSAQQTQTLLESLRQQCRKGLFTLRLPGMGTVNAYAAQLEIQAEGDGKIIPYTLVLVEG
ncbi:hypothetical protein U6B65_11035 [Oscillospiraceae bacterium MB08-C2-2]|nr:hypothetical protein U6B65_11035 [Oscillospiraceae bacterium MB08-C2-2]